MARYYDLVLGAIPLALGGVTTLLAVLGVSLTVAAPIAAAVAVSVIAHGIFVRAPIESPIRETPAENAPTAPLAD